MVAKRKTPATAGNQTPVVQSVANHFTDSYVIYFKQKVTGAEVAVAYFKVHPAVHL
jgi:hypothetical protein